MYINGSTNIVVDHENGEAEKLDSCREAISRIFLVKEDMHVVYGSGQDKTELDVRPNDILIVFYENSFVNKMIVAESPQWVANLLDYEAREQQRKEEWAQNQLNKCADSCADSCENTACPC